MRPCQQELRFSHGFLHAPGTIWMQAAIRHIRQLAQENHERALPKVQERLWAAGSCGPGVTEAVCSLVSEV